MIKNKFLVIVLYIFLADTPAFSYIGPGMGGGFIATIIGIFVALIAAFFGLIWFPIKKILKKKKNSEKESSDDTKKNIL